MKEPDGVAATADAGDGELLWGATARMTVSFLQTLGVLK